MIGSNEIEADVVVLKALGWVHMLMHSIVQESAKLMSSRPHASSKDRQAVQRNNALLLFAQNDMSGAAIPFLDMLVREDLRKPWSVAADTW